MRFVFPSQDDIKGQIRTFLFCIPAKVQAAKASSSSTTTTVSPLTDPSLNSVDTAGPVYDSSEVNGKFRITSEHWTDDLMDVNSDNYRKMSDTITRGIKELLEKDKLTEQAEFNVTIIGFS